LSASPPRLEKDDWTPKELQQIALGTWPERTTRTNSGPPAKGI
jgi:hypothetical protein